MEPGVELGHGGIDALHQQRNQNHDPTDGQEDVPDREDPFFELLPELGFRCDDVGPCSREYEKHHDVDDNLPYGFHVVSFDTHRSR